MGVKKCLENDCGRDSWAKGYCGRHYRIFKKHGYIKISYFDLSLEERIARSVKIKPSTRCVEWIGTLNPWGYGQIKYQKKTKLVHRVIWELANGSIEPGLCILHHCDNPKCCNIKHLWIGSHADNNIDMQIKDRGRHPKGTQCVFSKLTEEDVIEIRSLLKEGMPHRTIAMKFNVGKSAITSINTGLTWKHI